MNFKRAIACLILTAPLFVTACSSSSTRGSATTAAAPTTSTNGRETALAIVQDQLQAGAKLKALPSSLVSQLPTALGDYFTASDDAHGSSNGGPLITQGFVAGDSSATNTVVVFGDSNASMWIPSLDALGKSKGFKVLAYARGACPYSDAPGFLPGGKTVDPVCTQWRQAVIAEINQMSPPPVAVVLGQFQLVTQNKSGAASSSTVRGIRTTVNAIHVGSAPKIILIGYPVPTFDIPLCLSAHSGNIQTCAVPPPSTGVSDGTVIGQQELGWYSADRSSAIAGGGQAAWLQSLFCTATTCPPIANESIIFATLEHVSKSWAANVADAFGELLACSARTQSSSSVDQSWLTSTLGGTGACPAGTT